ncbi:hypothetical protein SCUP234_05297 [Seiridium cupressi]
MSHTKRSFSDFKAESSEDGQSEFHDQAAGSNAPKRQKSKQGQKAPAPPKNLNETKKRARNIERRFRVAENLPADKRIELERELAHLKQKIADAEDEKKTKKMISKYHMVRFFETKKANRLAKQIEKQIEETGDKGEIKKLKQDLHVAQIDSLYAKFFPYRERYISLYTTASGEQKTEDDEKPETSSSAAKALRAERPKLWNTIEKASKKGIPALMEIRDRRLGNDSRSKPPKERPSKHSFAAKAQIMKAKNPLVSGPRTTKPGEGRMELKNPRASKSKVEDSDDDSDGGFFETAD